MADHNGSFIFSIGLMRAKLWALEAIPTNCAHVCQAIGAYKVYS